MSQGDLERRLRLIDPICQAFEAELALGTGAAIDPWVPVDWAQSDADFLRRHLLELVADYREDSSTTGLPRAEIPIQTTPTSSGRTRVTEESSSWDSDERYELLEEIGRGGMGVVYRARHRILDREVALKTLLVDRQTDPALQQRFRSEAEAVAALDHECIVPLLEVGELAGQPFFAMPFYAGGHLGQQSTDLRRDHRRIAQLVVAIANGVQHAHERGILHRDLKLSNILLSEAGEPHIADFGLARRIDAVDGLTLSGQLLGTPHTLSPEQARGESASTASDVYGLGVILFELLAGQSPFKDDALLSLVKRIIEERSPKLESLVDGISKDLATIVAKCLEKDAGARYRSALDLANDLEAWLEGRPVAARPIGRVERLVLWAKREPGFAIALAAAFVLFLGLAIGGPLAARRQARLRRDADEATLVARARGGELRETLYASEMLRGSAWGFGAGSLESLQDLLLRWRPGSGRDDLRGFEWYLLRGLLNKAEHIDSISPRVYASAEAFSWSPDGERLAVVHNVELFVLKKTPRGWERGVHRKVSGAVVSVAFDHRGELLAVATGEQLMLLNAKTLEHSSSFPIGARCRRIEWSRDDKRLLLSVSSPGAPRAIVVVDPSSGESLARREMIEEDFDCDWAEFDPRDEDRVAHILTSQSSASVWSWREGSDAAQNLTGALAKMTVWEGRYSPNGELLALGTRAHGVQILDGRSLRWLTSLGDGADKMIRTLSWSPDSSMLAASLNDRMIAVWDLKRRRRSGLFRGHGAWLTHLEWSPDGERIASMDIGGNLRIWKASDRSAQTKIPIRAAGAGAVLLVVNPQSGVIAAVCHNRGLIFIDPQTKKAVSKGPVPFLGVTTIRWDAEGECLMLFGSQGGIARFREGEISVLHETSAPPRFVSLDGLCLPDEKGFLQADFNGRVNLFSQEGEPLRMLGPKAQYLALAMDEKANVIYAGHRTTAGERLHIRSAIQVFDAETLNGIRCIDLPDAVLTHMAPLDEEQLAVATEAGPVLVLDMRSGAILRILRGASTRSNCLALSPNGARLASGSHDGHLRIWDTKSWQLVFDVRAHEGRSIRSVAWAEQGAMLLSVGEDATIQIWDASRGRKLDALDR